MSIFDLFAKIEKKEEKNVGPVEAIIAGLGNPGAEYENTRHNAGFRAIDILAGSCGTEIKKANFSALTGEAVINGVRTLLVKPMTYMNESGKAVKAAADFYKIGHGNIIVLCDDVNLNVGKIRIRRKGSDGGQKGLRSVISHLGTEEFARIRVGVGKLPAGGDMVSWVLGGIPKELQNDFSAALSDAAEASKLVVAGKTDDAMCKYN